MRDWRDYAACQDMDTELWFPAGEYPKGDDLRRLQQARKICVVCMVRLECLTFAVRTGQRGVWGGLTEAQRRYSRVCRKIRQQVLAG